MLTTVVFDLDGTLIDSDDALAAPFVALGIAREDIVFGPVLEEQCGQLGVDVGAYLAAYDSTMAKPFAGVEELLTRVPRWAVCSNKHGPAGRDELARLGWRPAAALFADDFGGPKRLDPVLDALGATPAETIFVGDTGHDRACAELVGCTFALAGWNRRAEARPGDILLRRPTDLLDVLGIALD